MLGLFRLIPWAFMFIGVIWIIGGVGTLMSDVETEPTAVSIATLEKGQVPDAKWLEVSDGHLYWPEAVSHFKTRKTLHDNKVEEEVTKELGYYVPLVSAPLAQTWTRNRVAGEDVSYEKCRMIVFLPRSLAERKFPDITRGEPQQMMTSFVAKGRTKVASDLEDVVLGGLEDGARNFDPDGMLILRQGTAPLQKDTAGTMALMGLILAGPSFLWVRWRSRRRKAKAAASAAILPPGHESVHDFAHGVPAQRDGAAEHASQESRQHVSING